MEHQAFTYVAKSWLRAVNLFLPKTGTDTRERWMADDWKFHTCWWLGVGYSDSERL